jgi:nucleotide-binding universal stress UspA family protein
MRTMVLAADGSESGESALAFAIELALETGASLHVVSVRPHWDDRSRRVAERAASRARRAGIASTAHDLDGDTVCGIVDTALRVGAELLVVGSRGLGSTSGATLGSVAQALVRRSPIPVTIVRHVPALSTART